MGIGLHASSDGVAEVIIDFPPVNALPVQGWLDLADAVTGAGKDPGVRAVILAAEGRGFCAGVDIKEMQRTEGHAALIGANRGCFAAFAAVYECEVPVIAAVQGFCLGGGVGLAGSADIVIASARSNQPCTGSAFTGGNSMITSATPSLLRSWIPIAGLSLVIDLALAW